MLEVPQACWQSRCLLRWFERSCGGLAGRKGQDVLCGPHGECSRCFGLPTSVCLRLCYIPRTATPARKPRPSRRAVPIGLAVVLGSWVWALGRSICCLRGTIEGKDDGVLFWVVSGELLRRAGCAVVQGHRGRVAMWRASCVELSRNGLFTTQFPHPNCQHAAESSRAARSPPHLAARSWKACGVHDSGRARGGSQDAYARLVITVRHLHAAWSHPSARLHRLRPLLLPLRILHVVYTPSASASSSAAQLGMAGLISSTVSQTPQPYILRDHSQRTFARQSDVV